ncbi:MAG: hypothetical protein J5563_03795 [Clostridia bacterium]|nr:hypothetical protein [Clostridia bacterium]
MTDYYLSRLEREEARAYMKIYTATAAFEDRVAVPFGRKKSLELLKAVRLDHPEIFWLKGVSASGDAQGTAIFPEYSFKRKAVQPIESTIERTAERIIHPALGSDDRKKVAFVHDFILRNVVYTSAYRNFSHEIYGVLCNHIGVCEGIAKTVKYLLDMLQVDCLCVECLPDERNTAHSWNIVFVEGRPLHYDMTFDLTGKDRFRYFGLTDAQIFEDHRPPITEVPRCE